MDNGFLQREDFDNRLTAAREQTQERERHVGSPALGTKSGGKEVRLHVMHGHKWFFAHGRKSLSRIETDCHAWPLRVNVMHTGYNVQRTQCSA